MEMKPDAIDLFMDALSTALNKDRPGVGYCRLCRKPFVWHEVLGGMIFNRSPNGSIATASICGDCLKDQTSQDIQYDASALDA